MNNHWNMGEIWKNTFFSHYKNELFRIYLSLIWYLIYISCKLMHDKILTLIFEYFAISSKTMSFFVPERAHYLGYMSLREFFPMLLQVAPQNGQYHEFWPLIPSRQILPICRNQSCFKAAEYGGQSSGSSSYPPAGMFSSKYRTWTRWITAYGQYWPTLYSRWKFVILTILRSDMDKHGQSSPRLIYQIQCAPSGTECDIVFELISKNWISALNLYH